jgi:DNA-binding transcriptional LysR family regulator
MKVDLRHLRFVIAAGRYGSLRRAAEALRVRQSTISRALRALEERLGIVLFVRSSGGARPTPAGLELIEAADRLVGDFDMLVSKARALGRGAEGRISLGVPSSHAVTRLRPVLLDFARQYPGVQMRLAARPRSALLVDLKADALDVAVITGRAANNRIESLSLWSDQILLAVPEAHTLAASGNANWIDMSDEVVLTSCQGIGPELMEILSAKLGVIGKRPRIEEHAIGGEALLNLVAAGRGVSLHCDGTIRPPHPGLTLLEIHDGAGSTWVTYSACWKKKHTNPVLTSFLAVLRSHRLIVSSAPVPDT